MNKVKNIWTLFVLIALFVIPEAAFAKAGSYNYAKDALDSAWKFYSDYLMPQTETTLATVLSCAGVVLSMVWMLGIKWTRVNIGRVIGPLVAAISIAIILWDIAPAWLNVIMVIVAVIYVVRNLVALPGKGIGLAIGGLRKIATYNPADNPERKTNWPFAIIGSLWLAGFINSALVTNKESSYMPGILSALAGLCFIGWMIFGKRIRQRFANRNRQPTPPRPPNRLRPPTQDLTFCPKCGTENRPGYRFCKECGKPPTATVRSSSTDEDFDWGNVSNGTPRRLLKR